MSCALAVREDLQWTWHLLPPRGGISSSLIPHCHFHRDGAHSVSEQVPSTSPSGAHCGGFELPSSWGSCSEMYLWGEMGNRQVNTDHALGVGRLSLLRASCHSHGFLSLTGLPVTLVGCDSRREDYRALVLIRKGWAVSDLDLESGRHHCRTELVIMEEKGTKEAQTGREPELRPEDWCSCTLGTGCTQDTLWAPGSVVDLSAHPPQRC